MYDIVIRDGQVVDGTGDTPRTADVGIVDGTITEVGRITGRGAQEIDADGLVVAPGWVDIHTHFDGQVTWDETLSPSNEHGVTTALFGNCGVGFAPVVPERRDWLIELMEGVEDIPGAALAEGIRWEWESFPEYLDAVGRGAYAMDVGANLAHGALRGYVMGERGARNEEATADDLSAMARLVREAQDAGAFGVSTSRTIVHRAKNGEPVPGTFAPMEELDAIADAIAASGHGLLEVAPAGAAGEDFAAAPKELEWMAEVALRTGIPVTFLCMQANGLPTFYKEQILACEKVRHAGGVLRAQCSPRTVGLIVGLRSIYHPFSATPTWQTLKDLPHDQVVATLRADTDLQDRMVAEGANTLTGADAGGVGAWDTAFLLTDTELAYEPDPSTSIAARAARDGLDPRRVALDLLLAGDGENFLVAHFLNYSFGNLDASYEMLMSEDTVIGGSDAGAHVRIVCDASVPTFLLSHWVAGRTRGPRLPIEFVVRKQTADTARLYGLHDRGLIKPGLRADINVIDLDRVSLHRPRLANDLPSGAPRLLQGADGYRATMVAGQVVRRDGEDTGLRPGRLVRSRPRG